MLITIEGPNGVGKDYLIDKIKKRYKDKFEYITSKPKQNGIDDQRIIDRLQNIEKCSFEENIEIINVFLKNMEKISEELFENKNKIYLSNRWFLTTIVYGNIMIWDIFNDSSFNVLNILDNYKLYIPEMIILLNADLNIIKERLSLRNKYISWYEKTDERMKRIIEGFEELYLNNTDERTKYVNGSIINVDTNIKEYEKNIFKDLDAFLSY